MTQIIVYRGDITKLKIQCIVNASNPSGLGCNIPNHCVDSAIHLGAGPKLLDACKVLGGIPTTSAKITHGYNLPSKYIIHCTGPKIGENKKENHKLLAQCYINCLELARKYNIHEIAFCCISTGLYGYSKRKSCDTAVAIVQKYVKRYPLQFTKIIFCTYDSENTNIYLQKIAMIN